MTLVPPLPAQPTPGGIGTPGPPCPDHLIDYVTLNIGSPLCASFFLCLRGWCQFGGSLLTFALCDRVQSSSKWPLHAPACIRGKLEATDKKHQDSGGGGLSHLGSRALFPLSWLCRRAVLRGPVAGPGVSREMSSGWQILNEEGSIRGNAGGFEGSLRQLPTESPRSAQGTPGLDGGQAQARGRASTANRYK